MYQLVETPEQRKIFEEILEVGFGEKNYETSDQFKGKGRQSYLVKNKDREYAATFEMVPHSSCGENTILDYPEVFLEYDYINESTGSVIELDKLTVSFENRKNNTLDNVIEAIYLITKEQNIKYIVAELNPVFFRALKITFGITLIKVGKIREAKSKKYKIQMAIISLEEVWKEYETKHMLELEEKR